MAGFATVVTLCLPQFENLEVSCIAWVSLNTASTVLFSKVQHQLFA